MRSLPLSATSIVPEPSTASADGASSRPGPLPGDPMVCAGMPVPREKTGVRAVRAPARLVRVGRRAAEAHDPLVEVVGDEDAAGRIGGDVVRVAELTRTRARAGADAGQGMSPGIEDGDAVMLVVGD